MYRSSKYALSAESLNKFSVLFKAESSYPNITINPIEKETFVDDGFIRNESTGETIGFDWEIRDKYFANCKFTFDSLGQFERKIIKPSIELSIQCDSTQTGIIVAWHQDWKNEAKVSKKLATDTYDQDGQVRYTKHFKIYSYKEIKKFKEMLARAFATKEFNHTIF